MKIRRVKAVMTPFPHWIDAQEPLLAARDMMQELEVRHLPVKDEGELVSIVTDRDLKFAMDPNLGLPPREAMRVKEIAVYSAYVVDLDAALHVVLLEMADRRIGSALVTRHDQLCGILTTTDICRTFGEELRQRECPQGDPEAA